MQKPLMTIPAHASGSSLPNGLKLISYPHGNNPVLCLQIHIRVGSVYEKPEQNGFAHFLEHLSFKATRRFPANELSDFVPGLGASINAYTDFDSTCYYLNLPAEEMEQGFAILAELTRYPLLRKRDVSAEKDVIVEEIRQYENEPETNFIDYIQAHYFQNNPLRQPVLGSLKTVRNATAEALRSFHNLHYHPRNAFIVGCGLYDQQEFLRLADQYFGSWRSPKNWHPADFSAFLEPVEHRSGIFHRVKKSDSEFIALALPELSELHPFSDSYLVAMRYFAIGKSSLLHKRLVEQDKICSSVRVSSLSSNLSGITVIVLSPVLGASMSRIATAIREEYGKAARMMISEEDFELIKRDIIHGWAFDFESMENLAESLASEEMLGDFRTLYTYPRQIEALDIPKVTREIGKYWDKTRITCYYQSRSTVPELNLLSAIKPDTAILSPDIAPRNLSDTCKEPELALRTYQIRRSTEEYYQYQLDNGLKLLFKPEPDRPVTGFALCTDVSQLMESGSRRGDNFFCSAAMLYGTENHDHDQIMRYSRYHGFNIRVVHHLDATTFRGKCFSSSLPRALSLLAELVTIPRFDPRHLQMLKKMAIDSICRERDYPVSHGFNRWFSLLTGPESNMGPATGNISRIKSKLVSDLEAWHQILRDPRRFALTVVGDHDPTQILDLANAYFGQFPVPAQTAPEIRPQFREALRLSRKEDRDGSQAVIHLGSYGVKADEIEENTAFHLLAQVLGGDIGSRFYRELREKHGFAYQTGFDFTSISAMGFWYAYAFCDPDDHRAALELMRSLIAEVCAHGITPQELASTKQYLIGMNRFEHESVSWMAAQLSNLIALGYNADYFLNREARIRAIDLETVARVAARFLQASRQVTHILL